jgi:hypothetical protein
MNVLALQGLQEAPSAYIGGGGNAVKSCTSSYAACC